MAERRYRGFEGGPLFAKTIPGEHLSVEDSIRSLSYDKTIKSERAERSLVGRASHEQNSA